MVTTVVDKLIMYKYSRDMVFWMLTNHTVY